MSLRDTNNRPFLFDRLARYGFLPVQGSDLPVGFALGPDGSGRAQVGFTCSACHTREIKVQGRHYRIDGAPSLANIEQYTKDLDAAMHATVIDSRRFNEFLNRVIAVSRVVDDPKIQDKQALRSEVLQWQQKQHTWTTLTLPGPDMWGVGRVDALNQIFSRAAAELVSPDPNSFIVGNLHPADRPVRPPFLWNVGKQDFTQWAGTSANGNSDLALKRNYGQILGVGVLLRPVALPSGGFDMLAHNTANFDGLEILEALVTKMGPPEWPWEVDTQMVAQGQALFANHCASCHGITPGEHRPPNFETWATPVLNVGTDPTYYSTLTRIGSPGILSTILPSPVRLAAVTRTLSELSLKQYRPDIDFDYLVPTRAVGSFESRVLEGIWAAAPYLHNGSVPTLEDLLKPAAQRPATFPVGKNYDIQKVGLSSNQLPRPGYLYDTWVVGNSNAGHEYGTELNDQERAALLEFLKTL